MDIIGTAETKFQSEMAQASFDINLCVKNQSIENGPERLEKAIKKYQCAAKNLEMCGQLRQHLSDQQNPKEQPEANEG